MSDYELILITFLGLFSCAFIVVLWYKKKQKDIKEEFQKSYKLAEAKARIDRQKERERQLAADKERTVLRSHANYGHNRFNPRNPDVLLPERRVVMNSGSDDILTQMILIDAINSRNDITSGTVEWNDSVPTITPVEIAQSYSEPERSYSSSYSSPEPERSSYSSSYSSSSSDSSYSSSSSDSSYSSSSDSSSSSSGD